jgi:threonine/homoserine/homoserine lactone efflux protein
MGAAIGDVLGLAAGVAVSPLPIVAMILVLATPRGRVNGIVFGLGWVLGLGVLAVFVLIGSAGVLAPLVVYLVAGEGAARTLDSWKAWAATHNAAVMAVLFLVFGFKLVGDGLAVLF